MGAYPIEHSKPQCACGRPATHDVHNTYNALVGHFCRRCAEREVKRLGTMRYWPAVSTQPPPDDPWEGIPAERRLEFAVIRDRLEALAAGTILNLERALPPEIQNVLGAPAVLLMLAKSTETMFTAVRCLCADKPDDSVRRIALASATPPLLRSMLDAVCTVVFIGEDIPKRVEWYNKSGWREMLEEYDRHVRRYAGRADWDTWLAQTDAQLTAGQAQFGVTAQEAAAPSNIPWWPTPSQMRPQMQSVDARAFLDYMYDWFYKEFSQQDHLTLPGLIRRAGNFLRPQDERRTENTWRKLRSDWVTNAVLLFLTFLTEVVLVCGFDQLRGGCAYLWGVLKEYSPMAAEVYELRYQAKLA